MFLRILAAADYYSDNPKRMVNVEPVLVDIILDPYILNVFPRSLVSTSAYLLAVAILAGLVSHLARYWIREASPSFPVKKKKTK